MPSRPVLEAQAAPIGELRSALCEDDHAELRLESWLAIEDECRGRGWRSRLKPRDRSKASRAILAKYKKCDRKALRRNVQATNSLEDLGRLVCEHFAQREVSSLAENQSTLISSGGFEILMEALVNNQSIRSHQQRLYQMRERYRDKLCADARAAGVDLPHAIADGNIVLPLPPLPLSERTGTLCNATQRNAQICLPCLHLLFQTCQPNNVCGNLISFQLT